MASNTGPEQWLIGEPQFPDPQHARFRFSGPFDKRDVVWHCELYTLEAFARERLPQPPPPSLQQRLIITVRDGRHAVTVALRLPKIDRAAVYKTIIMLRNYKRLREGEHCYGPARVLRQDTGQ